MNRTRVNVQNCNASSVPCFSFITTTGTYQNRTFSSRTKRPHDRFIFSRDTLLTNVHTWRRHTWRICQKAPSPPFRHRDTHSGDSSFLISNNLNAYPRALPRWRRKCYKRNCPTLVSLTRNRDFYPPRVVSITAMAAPALFFKWIFQLFVSASATSNRGDSLDVINIQKEGNALARTRRRARPDSSKSSTFPPLLAPPTDTDPVWSIYMQGEALKRERMHNRPFPIFQSSLRCSSVRFSLLSLLFHRSYFYYLSSSFPFITLATCNAHREKLFAIAMYIYLRSI